MRKRNTPETSSIKKSLAASSLDSSLTMDGTRWESFSRRSKPLLEMSNEFEYGKEIEKFLNKVRHA